MVSVKVTRPIYPNNVAYSDSLLSVVSNEYLKCDYGDNGVEDCRLGELVPLGPQ